MRLSSFLLGYCLLGVSILTAQVHAAPVPSEFELSDSWLWQRGEMRESAKVAVDWFKTDKTEKHHSELAKPGLFYAGQDPTILNRKDQPSLKLAKKLKEEKGWVMVGGLVKIAKITDSEEWDTANDWAPVSKAFAESLTSGTAYFVYFRPPTMHPNVWTDYELPALLLNPHVHEVKTREVDSHGNWVTNDWVEIKKAKRENPFKAKPVAGQGSHLLVAGSSSPKTKPKKH